ncbi:MAG: hypothetical protein AB1558_14320 [Thermodesulfobacteriota bacterium]
MDFQFLHHPAIGLVGVAMGLFGIAEIVSTLELRGSPRGRR